jgi:hypothetical protein
MADGILETRDYDRYLSVSEKQERQAALAANEAFARAMTKAVARGGEKVRAGTFVDHSPTQARRIYAEARVSACGSPGAMCLESGAMQAGGAQSLK